MAPRAISAFREWKDGHSAVDGRKLSGGFPKLGVPVCRVRIFSKGVVLGFPIL